MPFDIKAFVKMFFDPKAIKDPLERAKFSALAKMGAFVRRSDKSSLKYRVAGKSLPHQPPYVHRSSRFTKKRTSRTTGAVTRQPASPLRELTFFAVDKQAGSVVIGPAIFASKLGAGKVPRVVEEGGVARFRTPDGLVKTGNFRPRPHTLPAFRANMPKWKQMLKDAIHKVT